MKLLLEVEDGRCGPLGAGRCRRTGHLCGLAPQARAMPRPVSPSRHAGGGPRQVRGHGLYLHTHSVSHLSRNSLVLVGAEPDGNLDHRAGPGPGEQVAGRHPSGEVGSSLLIASAGPAGRSLTSAFRVFGSPFRSQIFDVWSEHTAIRFQFESANKHSVSIHIFPERWSRLK